MKRAVNIVLAFFVLILFGHGVVWAQYDEERPLSDSSSTESGWEEMRDMDYQMEPQADDGRMDVQAGDAIDSEGTGAH